MRPARVEGDVVPGADVDRRVLRADARAAGLDDGMLARPRRMTFAALRLAGMQDLLIAVFAGAAATLFAALPGAFVAALAGLGLLGVGAAFWGLVVGIVAGVFLRRDDPPTAP